MFLFLSFSWKRTLSHYKPPPDIYWTPKLVHWPRKFLWWNATALVTKSIARWVLSVCRHILLLAPDLHTINVPWWWMNNSSLNDSLEYLEGNGGAIWCGKWEYVIAPLIHGIYSNPVRGGKCLSWLRGNVCDWLFFGSNQFIMLTEEIGRWEKVKKENIILFQIWTSYGLKIPAALLLWVNISFFKDFFH